MDLAALSQGTSVVLSFQCVLYFYGSVLERYINANSDGSPSAPRRYRKLNANAHDGNSIQGCTSGNDGRDDGVHPPQRKFCS